MAKSRLQAALANEKGVDFKKVVQKRKQKEALRQKRKEGKPVTKAKKQEEAVEAGSDEDEWEEDDDSELDDEENDMAELIDREAEEGSSDEDEDEEDEEGNGTGIDFAKFEHDESSSDSEVEMEEKIERPKKAKSTDPKPKISDKKQPKQKSKKNEPEDSEEEDDDEEEDIDMEDLEDLADEDREDLVPHTRTTINNHTALLASLRRIGIPTDSSVPFATHQSVVSSKPTADSIEDIQDDLQRELAFYAQALEAAKSGRALLLKEGVPFSRPNDYFAEMVKSDGQMEKVKAKLVEEATSKKAAAEARKQRDLKKFGKQVQVAKEQERAKQKRETLDKIKTLKRKRAEGSGAGLGATEADDLFDVAVDDEISRHDKKSAGKRPGDAGGAPNAKRQKKDSKFGFGGKKRHAKSGDAVSSGDMSGFSVKRMKSGGKGGKTPRLGKSKRKAVAGKR